MSNQKVIILTKKQIQQKIERMAYQILEDNLDEREIVGHKRIGSTPKVSG